MSRIPLVEIFISSPGDVREERVAVVEVINELQSRPNYIRSVSLRALWWEDPVLKLPLPNNRPPQASVDKGLAKPSSCDIVIGILGRRMGSPLEGRTKEDGKTPYLSGTEYELEDAFKPHAKAEVMLYFTERDTIASLPSKEKPGWRERRRQYDLVTKFKQHLKRMAKTYPFEYATIPEFKELVTKHLDRLIDSRIQSGQRFLDERKTEASQPLNPAIEIRQNFAKFLARAYPARELAGTLWQASLGEPMEGIFENTSMEDVYCDLFTGHEFSDHKFFKLVQFVCAENAARGHITRQAEADAIAAKAQHLLTKSLYEVLRSKGLWVKARPFVNRSHLHEALPILQHPSSILRISAPDGIKGKSWSLLLIADRAREMNLDFHLIDFRNCAQELRADPQPLVRHLLDKLIPGAAASLPVGPDRPAAPGTTAERLVNAFVDAWEKRSPAASKIVAFDHINDATVAQQVQDFLLGLTREAANPLGRLDGFHLVLVSPSQYLDRENAPIITDDQAEMITLELAEKYYNRIIETVSYLDGRKEESWQNFESIRRTLPGPSQSMERAVALAVRAMVENVRAGQIL